MPVRPGTPLYRALEATARAVAAKLADRKDDGRQGRNLAAAVEIVIPIGFNNDHSATAWAARLGGPHAIFFSGQPVAWL